MNTFRLVLPLLLAGALLASPAFPQIASIPPLRLASDGPVAGPPIRVGLQAYLDGKLLEEKVKIEYTDIHGLWGGEAMTLDGAGNYYRKKVERGGKIDEARNEIDRGEVDKIVRILLEVAAWEQRTPVASQTPDESRAFLRLRVGSETSEIWERYNELLGNHRVGRVKDALRVIGEHK